MDDIVVVCDMPKAVTVDGHSFRHMLPSGVHCNGCHGLVSCEEAIIGMDGVDFCAVVSLPTLYAILQAHLDFTCRAVSPAFPIGLEAA